jgi:hypothetical protein
MITFRQCAEHYLRQWCDPNRKSRFPDLDCDFVKQFQSRDGITCEQLARFFVCYAVARTIPGRDLPEDKYEKFVKMLKDHRRAAITPRFIEDRVEEMKRPYQKKLLSAISKAFWMLRQHPVVIYDGNACKGLGRFGLQPGNGDYSRYVKSWVEFSQRPNVSKQLRDALRWLPKSRAARSLRYKISAKQVEQEAAKVG